MRRDILPKAVIALLCVGIGVISCAKISHAATPWTSVMGSSSGIDWSQSGIPGGIPARTVVCATIDASLYGHDTTDATQVIQNALNACPANEVVYLPAGTYRINGSLSMPSNVTLRGAGPSQTILDAHGSGTAVVQMGSGSPNFNASVAMSGNLAKGSTQITVANASSITVGSYLVLSELNDPALVTNVGSEGTCTWCDGGQANGTRAAGQTVQVTSVNGNVIGIAPGLYMNYQSSLLPEATPFQASVQYAGVEDLQIYANDTGYSANFSMDEAAYSWINNVESNYADGDHVDVDWSYRGQISNSYFHDAYLHTPGTSDSDIAVRNKTSGMLIENNIFRRLHVSMMAEWGASGNVFAYNFSSGNFDAGSTNFLLGDIDFHGAHPMYNLFEGNVAAAFNADSVWGSSSNNTLFRNYFLGTTRICDPLSGRGAVTATCWWAVQDVRAVEMAYPSLYNNIVGNVVGSSAQMNLTHYNDGSTILPSQALLVAPATRSYDAKTYGFEFGYGEASDNGSYAKDSSAPYATAFLDGNYTWANGQLSWASSDTSHTLPPSFFLSSKPAFFGSLAWPAIGPGIAGYIGTIPAEYCYDKGLMPDCLVSSPAVAPTPSPSITSPLSATASVGVPFSYTITASQSPTSYTATGLPSGLTLTAATGLISGTPSAPGTYSITISASNSGGAGTAVLTLTVAGGATTPPPSTSSGSAPAGTYVQNAAQNSGASVNALSLPSATRTGDLLVAEVDWTGGGAFSSIHDTQGNVWQEIGTPQQSSAVNVQSRLYYATSIKGGPDTITTTVGGTPLYHELFVNEYAGVGTLDAFGVAGGTGSSFSSGNVNVHAQDLLVGSEIDSSYASVASGWTARSGLDGDVIADRSASASGGYAFTGSSGGGYLAWIAAFAPSASGASSTSGTAVTDTVPPAVAIQSPLSGAAVSGTVAVAVNATDNVGVVSVAWYVDGVLQTTETAPPYVWDWHTSAFTNGTHALSAKAYDAAQNVGTSPSIAVIVENPLAPPSTTPSGASPSIPMNMKTVTVTASQVLLAWDPSIDTIPIAGYMVYRGGIRIGTTTATTYRDTSVAPGVQYMYTAAAYDTAGNVSGQSSPVLATVPSLPSPPAGNPPSSGGSTSAPGGSSGAGSSGGGSSSNNNSSGGGGGGYTPPIRASNGGSGAGSAGAGGAADGAQGGTAAPQGGTGTTFTMPTSRAGLTALLQSLLTQFQSLTADLNANLATSFTRNLTIGDAGIDVKDLQIYLNDHGDAVASTGPGSPGNETEYFGPATARALAAWQAAHGLPAYGYFGPLTREKIAALGAGASRAQSGAVQSTTTTSFGSSSYDGATSSLPSSSSSSSSGPFIENLAFGDSNTEVATLQRFLAENPSIYPQGFVTGYYGLDTVRAVEIFQHLYGINATAYGAVGAPTRQTLNRLYGAGEKP